MLSFPEPLRIPDFRLYWIARFAAVLATMGMVVIIGYQVYDVARSDYGMSIREASFQIGLVGLCQFVPIALLTPVAGWAADRFERRTVARIANAIDMIVALALGWLTLPGRADAPIPFRHGRAARRCPRLRRPGDGGDRPEHRARRAAAQGDRHELDRLADRIGRRAGARRLPLRRPDPAPYWFAAALMLIAIVALTPIRRVVPPPIAGERHPVRQMAEGLTYVRRHRFLLGAITLDLFAVLLGGATAMLPVYARDILHVGTEGLGLLRAAPAVGAALVALWYAFSPLKPNVGIKMLLSRSPPSAS